MLQRTHLLLEYVIKRMSKQTLYPGKQYKICRIQALVLKYFIYFMGGPNITANLYCICSSRHETCAYADAVQICDHL